MAVVERFDIEKVAEIFRNSLVEEADENDVLLEHYLQAYEEINKFFQLLGSVFGFVSSDIVSKIDILQEFRKDAEKSEKFSTIKKMMLYEIEAGLLNDVNYVSGSRTLLRLHRGLEFVYEFLSRLSHLNESDKVHTTCKNAYNDTLAKYHPWIIRKGAVYAMYALPTQGELLKRVCTNVPRAKEMLPDMLRHTRIVYDRTQHLYQIYDLHGLP